MMSHSGKSPRNLIERIESPPEAERRSQAKKSLNLIERIESSLYKLRKLVFGYRRNLIERIESKPTPRLLSILL